MKAGRRLGEARLRAHRSLPGLGGALHLPNAMEALRAGIAQLSVEALAEAPAEANEELDPRYELVGACAVYAAAWERLRGGREPMVEEPTSRRAMDELIIE